jgi:hypothetical protein
MSATNRGAVRNAQDFYPTPTWLTEAIIPFLGRCHPQRILEPAAGDGAIVDVLRAAFPVAIDHGDITTGQDFLTTPTRYQAPYDLIITNPPCRLAREFISRALELRRTDRSVVAMLLRLNYLEGQERAPWMRAHMPSVYVTPRRPRFTGAGTDATAYAWFIWDGEPTTLVILETEQPRTSKSY